jgi:hypothetical protein
VIERFGGMKESGVEITEGLGVELVDAPEAAELALRTVLVAVMVAILRGQLAA